MKLPFHLWLAFVAVLLAAPAPLSAADAATTAKPIRVICLGDSVTAGARLKDPAKDAYPARLQSLLGDGYVVSNYGVGGCTLIHQGQPNVWSTLKRIQKDKCEPDIVVINLGINDTCGAPRHCWDHQADFAGDYRELIAALRALPSQPRLWLCAPTPMALEASGVNSSRRQNLAERIPRLDELIGVVRQIVKEQGTGFIDLHTPFLGKPELFTNDGVHPNQAGYAAIAKVVAQALKQTSP
jgi:lysophospholipase L1-like esterase